MDAGPEPAASNAAPSPFDGDMLVPRKALVDDARFDVTAMVDLVFMMNIFFLVTWAEMARAEIDLPRAKHCSAAERSTSIVFAITKPDSGVAFFLGDGPSGLPIGPNELEKKVTEMVEDAVREGRTTVLIKAEREVPLRDVARLAGIATAVKDTQLMLAVIENK
jgi:biopolymer transport protein ExbD